MSKIIGIDLGTTNSVVAVMQGGEPVVIPNQEGDAHNAFGGGHHQGGGAARGASGEAPSRDESRKIRCIRSSASWAGATTKSPKR